MAHLGRIFVDEAGTLHAMRPARQILQLNPPCTTTMCSICNLAPLEQVIDDHIADGR